ncbi:MAG: zinc ribbon domain-containing protein [Candidatus Omnitrophica bacterium]|nr:zinc ribbon domain-containing protein [Candidatus Omnitrophota bacterium]
MPTYGYECLNCGDIFETFQKITDEPLEKCSKCNGKLKRLIGTGIGIIFKGPGFYATDYRKKPPKEDLSNKAESSSNCCPGKDK